MQMVIGITAAVLGMALPGALTETVAATGAQKPTGIAVVVNEKGAPDSLSMSELRKVLLGDRQYWGENQRITILLRPQGTREREVVLKKVYKMDEAQFRQYWIGKVFRAEAPSAPKVVSTSQTALDLAAGLPGAITFVENAQPPKGAKLIRIGGKLPDEKGYPLQ